MNKELIETNNNHGAVLDENGNVNLIKKENDSCQFEEILSKENDLENLKSQLEDHQHDLNWNEIKTGLAKIYNFLAIAVAIIPFVFSPISLPTLGVSLFFYSCIKVGSLCVWGTKRRRNREKQKLTSDIETKKLEISNLEKELTKAKEKAKYKVEKPTINQSKEENYRKESSLEFSIPIDNDNSKKNNKVKVLSLSKR